MVKIDKASGGLDLQWHITSVLVVLTNPFCCRPSKKQMNKAQEIQSHADKKDMHNFYNLHIDPYPRPYTPASNYQIKTPWQHWVFVTCCKDSVLKYWSFWYLVFNMNVVLELQHNEVNNSNTVYYSVIIQSWILSWFSWCLAWLNEEFSRTQNILKQYPFRNDFPLQVLHMHRKPAMQNWDVIFSVVYGMYTVFILHHRPQV